MMKEESDCHLCKEFIRKNINDSYFYKLYPEFEHNNRTILESDNFVVATDMAPVSNTHLLIIPKKHYLCFVPSR